MQALASAPPPTWTKRRSSERPSWSSAPAISQARVSPPSTVSPLSLPWQQNGRAPPATAARKAW